MITKYRNRSLIQFACAFGMTVTFFVVFYIVTHREGPVSRVWAPLAVLWYFATLTLWAMASFTLAKAKGYDTDQMGAVLLFLYLVSCCVPGAMFVFPAVAIGLRDKTRRHRHRGRVT